MFVTEEGIIISFNEEQLEIEDLRIDIDLEISSINKCTNTNRSYKRRNINLFQ